MARNIEGKWGQSGMRRTRVRLFRERKSTTSKNRWWFRRGQKEEKMEREGEKERKEVASRIIKIHKITDAVAISDALLTLAIQLRPRDACKFSSGGRSLATFFVECHCVCRSRADSYHTAPATRAPARVSSPRRRPYTPIPTKRGHPNERTPLESPSRW